MKLSYLLAVVISVIAFNAPAYSQDNHTLESKPQQEDDRPTFGITHHLQKQLHLLRLDMLKLTSNRQLRFRAGDYWVDVRSRLIDIDDRDIGMWGVDEGPVSNTKR